MIKQVTRYICQQNKSELYHVKEVKMHDTAAFYNGYVIYKARETAQAYCDQQNARIARKRGNL